VYVVGRQAKDAIIQRFDGSEWLTSFATREFGISAVWGSSPSDVWAVGAAIAHYNGKEWHTVAGNLEEMAEPDEQVNKSNLAGLSAIWGISASDIFIIGQGIVHYDGRRWTSADTPKIHRYPSVFRDAHLPFPTVDWVAKPFLRLYNAVSETSIRRWLRPAARIAATAIDDGNGGPLFMAISGSSATDIYVVGEAGFPLRAPILHYGRDHKWRTIDSGQEIGLGSVFCLPSGAAYAVGGGSWGILHYDGKPCNEPPAAQGWRRLLFWRH